MAEYLTGHIVHQHMAVIHHDHPVTGGGLLHVVGNQHHGDALFAVQLPQHPHYLLAAAGIQHGSGLIQQDAPGLHGDDARDGHPLLLPATELMRRAFPVFVHPHRFQGLIHPPADLSRLHAHIFGREGHILFHHRRHDLVIRVLEHHAGALADLKQLVLVLGIHAVHGDGTGAGQQHGVAVLGKGGFPGAIVPQHRHKLAFPYGDIHILQHQRQAGLFLVTEGDMLGFDQLFQNAFLAFFVVLVPAMPCGTAAALAPLLQGAGTRAAGPAAKPPKRTSGPLARRRRRRAACGPPCPFFTPCCATRRWNRKAGGSRWLLPAARSRRRR